MKPTHIIAIGTSEGGLEALASFFDHTPPDGISYVILSPLPAEKSRIADIVARHSRLEVVEATEGMLVNTNKVYFIPDAQNMGIKKDRLYLTGDTAHDAHPVIDTFFDSLAADRGSTAIGIVLSGTGNDGAAGARSIQQGGGIIMVQDPDDALFDSMPAAAIASSNTNYILPSGALPVAIEEYVQDSYLPASDQQKPLAESFLSAVIALIKENFSFNFTNYKIPTITRRIRRRMIVHDLNEEEAYYSFLKQHPEECERLMSDFFIGVTSFFRDPKAFEMIAEQVIPELIEGKEDGSLLKIWIACCATGEEAYSIAILVKEYLLKNNRSLEVKIFSTDINKHVLDQAARGVFASEIEKHVSEQRLNQFFEKTGNNYKIKTEIRNMLIFAQHDLIKNPGYCHVDLISCRNMLIYVKPALQKQILSKLSFGLKTGGYLFLGSSEHIASNQDEYEELSARHKIFKRTTIRRNLIPQEYLANSIPDLKIVQPLKMQQNINPPVSSALPPELIDVMIAEYDLAGISIDDELKANRAYGDVSPYLKQEQFNFNLQELLPDPLAIAFSSAVQKVSETNGRVKLSNIRFNVPDSGTRMSVDLIVAPFQDKKTKKKGMLVLFKPVDIEHEQSSDSENFDLDTYAKEYMLHLEEELAQSRRDLQLSNDLLESSNETMQSFNEELLSANEEMQSANEELQSMNEELETINTEHQFTIEELTTLNDDLNNYFRNSIYGQLFVDSELCLRKYSPSAAKNINIRENDIGKPLVNISASIRFDLLIEDAGTVISTGEVIVRHVESDDGRIHQVMIGPYIRHKDTIPYGAVITFYDITELKKIQQELDRSNKHLLRINADLDNFVYAASHDLLSPINNIEATLKILRTKLDTTDPLVVKFANVIDRSIVNFKAVINDMAIIGAIEADMRKDSPLINFEQAFDEIRESISDKIENAGASFSTDFQEKEIKFSKKNLRSIILNLVTNALKFKHPERAPEILIRTEKYKECILLTVKDNGMGISETRLDFIFKMYHRLNENMEGQGIGLYLIKKIIDASGGRVKVESEVGSGTTFKIYFKI